MSWSCHRQPQLDFIFAGRSVMLAKAVPVFIALLLVPWPHAGAGGRCPASNTPLRDASRPGVYLEQRQRPKSDQRARRIWLTLRNNYGFPITVGTYPLDDQTFVQDTASEEVGVVYDVGSTSHASDRVLRSADAPHVITGYLIKPGEDLRFSVPANDLAESKYLRIPFTMTAEDDATKLIAAPQHFALFYAATLTR